MAILKEHQKFDTAVIDGLDAESLKWRINYDTRCFEPGMVNLLRYEFDPAALRDGFYSYFRIGAEWLDAGQTLPLVVLPKMEGIDYVEMFMKCLETAESADGFSDIYSIDFESRPVESEALSSILSPLLVVRYLMSVKRVVSRGLRKGYVCRSESINKVKGRIDIRRTMRMHLMGGHNEKVFCHYDEYSVDTLENRMLKRALRVAADMIAMMTGNNACVRLTALCNDCLSAFQGVTDISESCVPAIKKNHIYREYDDAIRAAVMLLRRHDMAVASTAAEARHLVPVFRIDMALLFEHYVLALLRRRYGLRAVKYQVRGYGGRFIADFLISDGNEKIIADAKYIDGDESTVVKGDYIKQLSAYGRDEVILKSLGYDSSDEDALPVVPCVLLYPVWGDSPVTSLLANKVKATVKFYTFGIKIPRL